MLARHGSSPSPHAKAQQPSLSPVPSGHAVQFYESDAALIEEVGQRFASALSSGDTAIVVATKAHRDALATELRDRGVELASAVEQGRYIELDAAETLARFMIRGHVDPQLFFGSVGVTVARAVAATKRGRGVVIFGEMVALLWSDAQKAATVRLEELWNQLRERYHFFLLCGYPISGFDRTEHRQLFFNICGEHSEVEPAESYPAHGSEPQRRRSIARLQQKARALETEIQLSQQRILMLQGLTNAGSWELDLQDDTFSFSSAAARLLGLQSGRLRISQLLDLMYYSGDRDLVRASLGRARTGRRQFVVHFRIRRGSRIRVLEIRGKTIHNAGYPLILGVLCDVTPQARAA